MLVVMMLHPARFAFCKLNPVANKSNLNGSSLIYPPNFTTLKATPLPPIFPNFRRLPMTLSGNGSAPTLQPPISASSSGFLVVASKVLKENPSTSYPLHLAANTPAKTAKSDTPTAMLYDKTKPRGRYSHC